MSRSINKVILVGTLGRDPDVRSLANGSMVASFSLATDESYNDKNTGQKVEQTEWHKVTAFGKIAEIVAQYVKKGHKLYVEGKLKTDEYEKDGIKRYSTGIIINDLLMLTPREQNQPQQQNSYPAAGYAQPNTQQQAPVYQTQQHPMYANQPAQQNSGHQQPHIQQPQAQQQQNTPEDFFGDDIPF